MCRGIHSLASSRLGVLIVFVLSGLWFLPRCNLVKAGRRFVFRYSLLARAARTSRLFVVE
jgi:hypothetical protein